MKPMGLEAFDAYRVAKQFFALVWKTCSPLPESWHKDQLIRASESVMRNICEAYPITGADRKRRFRLAAGEACECVASIDILEIRGAISAQTIAELRTLLDRSRAMLYRLSRPG